MNRKFLPVIFLWTIFNFFIEENSARFYMYRKSGLNKKTPDQQNNVLMEQDEFFFDEVDLPEDQVFECFRCSGKYCSDMFIGFKIRVEKRTCDPGDICWKGYTKYGTQRGCGSRNCTYNEYGSNGQSLNDTLFYANNCCIENLCNEAAIQSFSDTIYYSLSFVSILLNKYFLN